MHDEKCVALILHKQAEFNYDQSVQHLSHRLRQTFSGSFNAWAHLAGAGAQTPYPLMLRGNGGWDRREGG
jgi:hypothetical protein